MEKPAATKSKNKILKFLHKAVSFKNLPFSARRDLRTDVNLHRLKTLQSKGFSGPLIPAEARRKSKNSETPEPTSPKVSCIGQIKHKNKNKNTISKKKHVSLPKEFKSADTGKIRAAAEITKKKNESSGIKKLFGGGRKSDASIDYKRPPPLPETAPRLNQMRKFASSRDTFANFDWTTAQIAPEDDRGVYTDEERGYSDGEDDVIFPFSAPILTAGAGGVSGLDLEPTKEINLWKRRTMSQPMSLEMNVNREN